MATDRRSSGSLVALLAVCASVAMLVTACSGSRALDTGDVERQIADSLSEQVGGTYAVACPDEVPVSSGASFACTITDADGVATSVTVTQQDDQGRFSWQVEGSG